MRNALMLIVALSLAACVPVPFDYYYISLVDVEEIKILETGRSSFSGFFHKPMPIRYEIARQTYVLDIEFDRRTFQPSVWINATGESGEWLHIESVNASRCGDWHQFVSGKQLRSRFYWSLITDPSCLPENFVDLEELVIVFNVIGDDGEYLGREQFPIKIVRNGTMFDFDSI